MFVVFFQRRISAHPFRASDAVSCLLLTLFGRFLLPTVEINYLHSKLADEVVCSWA